MSYAKLPSGIILPQDMARAAVAEMMFGGGAYRTASRSNKNTISWQTSTGSADTDSIGDLPTLRAQSRDLVRNEALPSGAISGVVTSVVGSGIVPQSRIDYERVGLTAEQADKWQKEAERLFAHVAEKKTFDVEGRSNFYEQQDLVLRAKLESGDCFAVRRFIERPGKVLATCVQVIEADRVATPPTLAANTKVRMGVETDDYGLPIAYHIAQTHPGERFVVGSDALKYTKLPARDKNGVEIVLPIVHVKRPGQTRGVPYLAPVIEVFKQLSRYTEAEVTAAVISGMFAVFVTSPSPTSPLNMPSNFGSIPGQVGAGAPVPTGTGLQKLQSGMIVDLAPGEDIKTANTTRPNTSFDPFVNSVLRQIGMALEVPFELLIKHFSASYSASRAAILEAWRFFMRERSFLVASYCQPVWAWVIDEAVARGLLEAPNYFNDPLVREAYLSAEWIGSAPPQVDPTKEAKAAQAWYDLGVISLQDICWQQGRDYDRTYRQRLKEKKQMERDYPEAQAPQGGNAQQGVPQNEDGSDIPMGALATNEYGSTIRWNGEFWVEADDE